MRSGRSSAGMTLVEVMIASVILALVIALTMGMLGQFVGSCEMDMKQTYAEDHVQNTVDRIIEDLKETSPAKVTFYQFVEDGCTQTALCLPGARDWSGEFVFRVGGQVQSQPVWQCIKVYCYRPDGSGGGGELICYEDFSERSYVNPISVSALTSDEIGLSDGTVFPRYGPPGADQRILRMGGRFVQMEAAVPSDEGVADFEVDPELVEDVVMDQEVRPLRLTVRSAVEHSHPALAGGTVITTLTNEVLSRNRN